MFYYIKGTLVLAEESLAVIDAGGVAYAMTVSTNTQSAVSAKAFSGEAETKLFTYLSVREDGVELFGFDTLSELEMFKLLVSVSGIGPKAAMSILSFMTPDSIARAIVTEDKKAISKAPGIGPKTAARVILELKDKVKGTADTSEFEQIYNSNSSYSQGKHSEAVDALTVLGFNRNSAEDALRTVDVDNLDLEDIIREALKKLMK